ncbi:TraB/GumN family protein [Hyphobacterium sp. HN65]|uniref:TraB/GumN family protein n=1 Tax=Hyphobacterium lacteum TaxID=3116575 RepID=A0ABU7LS33_9PROT|nr:TraB/GumN family protein [Hyphobacterium sp. HN65]MEE2526727.1 TraB/GumN family protein [Hyphobacterium sp. HN65]
MSMNFIRTLGSGLIATALLAGTAFADPSLWHIEDEDSDIYIFGTVHILRPGLDWQSEEIMEAFESADTVYFEAPVNDPEQAASMRSALLMNAANPAGVTLSSLVSEDTWARIERFAPRAGLSAAQLETVRPWLASVTLGVGFIQAAGYDPNSGVESTLWPLASEAGKTLAYFETVEEQVGFFANLPPEIELELLEQTVSDLEAGPDQLDSLVTAWANGDQSTIDNVMNAQMRADAPHVHDVIIVQRNERWAEEIEDMLAGSGTIFIAVGSGHLPGEQGVISLLRDRGITVAGP